MALPALGLKAPLRFEALADFHPDQLFERVEIFDRLRTLRQRLQNPSTFAAAADELRSDAPAQPSLRGADSGPVPTDVTDENRGALLDRLLGTPARGPSTPSESNQPRAQAGVEAFIRSLVAPYIVADTAPQLRQLLSAVDAAIGDAMRSLLHDAAFQRLEATWRGVQWLLASVGEIEGDVGISLLHLTREDLRVQAHPDSRPRAAPRSRRRRRNPMVAGRRRLFVWSLGRRHGNAPKRWRILWPPQSPARRRRRRRTCRMRRPPDPGRPENLDDTTA